MLMTNITFFLVNIAKTSRTHAPKKPYDELKKTYLDYPLKQNDNSDVQHVQLNQ